MFRSSKKKKLPASKRRRIVRSFDDENDDENDEHDREQLPPIPGETTGDGGIVTAKTKTKTNTANTNTNTNDNDNTKSSTNTTRTKPADDDSDEEEPPSALLLLRQRKTANKKRGKRRLGGSGGLVVRSFDVEEADDENDNHNDDDDDEDDDDDDDDRRVRNHKDKDKDKHKHKHKHKKKHKHKQKRKRNGLGFGGGDTSMALGDNDDENESENKNENKNNDNHNYDTNNMNRVGSAPTQTYGREALEQLRAEQNRTKPLQASGGNTGDNNRNNDNENGNGNDNGNGNGNDNGNGNVNGNPPAKEDEDDDDDEEEESFIPLNGDPPGNAPPRNVPASNESIFAVDPTPEEPSGWEKQVEQRAGIRTTTAAMATQSRSQSRSHPHPQSQLLSLSDLSRKLRSTVEALKVQSNDLCQTTNRRRADRDHAVSESETHETTHLSGTGTACEFYQTTRRDLTLWVGALRDLHTKIEPVRDAFVEMLTTQIREEGRDLRSWQDDCCAVLRETNKLEAIVGRQPLSLLSSSSPSPSVVVVCDEFGRDVRSQYLRDREARFRDRMARMGGGGDGDSDNNNKDRKTSIVACHGHGRDHDHDHDEEKRSETLLEALQVAMDDLDEAYTSETRFRSVFDRWFATYPEDYKQCFATLSFGDLYAVFVKMELCRSGFFSGLLFSSSSSSSSLASSSSLPSGTVVATTGKEPKGSTPSFVRGLLERCCVGSSSPRDSTGNQDTNETETTDDDESTRTENEGRWVRSVEKSLLPMLIEILEDGGAKNNTIGETNTAGSGDCFGLFHSSRKSLLLSKLVAEALRHPSGGPNDGATATAAATSHSSSSSTSLRQSLEKSLSSSIHRTLDGIAIPILRANGNGRNGNSNSESNREGDGPTNKESSSPPLLSVSSGAEDCSMRYALTYQAEILRQTLCNIIVHWLPLISLEDSNSNNNNNNSSSNANSNDDSSPNGIHAVLDFVNEKYLLLLSSLENAREQETPGALISLSAKSLFAPVWEALHRDPRNILDSPSLMLATMPLRAAARAYSLQ